MGISVSKLLWILIIVFVLIASYFTYHVVRMKSEHSEQSHKHQQLKQP